jgi:hypothetical protein
VLGVFVQESDCGEIGVKFIYKTSQESTESGVALRVDATRTWRMCSADLTETAYLPDSSGICYVGSPVCRGHVMRADSGDMEGRLERQWWYRHWAKLTGAVVLPLLLL